jgi:hypothetical protein
MRKLVTTAAAIGLAALSACGSSGGRSGLSVSVKAATAATSSPAGLAVQGGITISRVRIAVRRISVEGGDAAGACEPAGLPTTARPLSAMKGMGGQGPSLPGAMDPSGDASADETRRDDGPQRGDDGGCELAFGPFDVDLAGSALSGGVAHAFSAPVPAGTYGRVAITVNTVPAARAGANPVLQDLAAAHASLLVDGFVQEAGSTTRPFTFATPMQVKQVREGAIVLGPTSNVTLTFDPSGWFVAPGGGRLDPVDPTVQGSILANIRASIRLVHDDDHDGLDDETEHGSGRR